MDVESDTIDFCRIGGGGASRPTGGLAQGVGGRPPAPGRRPGGGAALAIRLSIRY